MIYNQGACNSESIRCRENNEIRRENTLLVGGKDESCAIVEVYADRPIRESIAHTILITVVDPRRDEHALLR